MGTIFALTKIKKEFNIDTSDALFIINKDSIDCERIQKILHVVEFVELNQYLKSTIYLELLSSSIDDILLKYKILF